MTPLAALALAIRDRLVAGAPAPLPGLGTLGRAHVSARVHTDAGGRRVLMPPGEAVAEESPVEAADGAEPHDEDGAAPEASAANARASSSLPAWMGKTPLNTPMSVSSGVER